MAIDHHALILENARIPASLQATLHHNNLSWAPHPEKPLGRLCNDDTYHQSGHSLNSEWSKEAADERWGKSFCPSIVEVVRSFLQFSEDSGVPLEDLVIVKDDVSKAFTQVRYSHAAAVRHATTPEPGSTMIQSRVVFGGDDSAQIWECVARAIQRLIQDRITKVSPYAIACIFRYVDDFFGLVVYAHQEAIKGIIQGTIREALSDSAVNVAKSIPHMDTPLAPTRQKDIIGFDFDLTRRSLRPNLKGRHKLFRAFFLHIDLTATSVPLKARQSAASLVQRFATVIRGMRPFVQPLHDWCVPSKLKGKKAARFLPVRATSAVTFCIEMWRALLISTFHDPTLLDVPLTYVANLSRISAAPPTYVAQTDASELGACISIWDPTHTTVLAWIQVLYPWGKDLETGGSSQLVRSAQNMREYTAYCFVLILLHLHPSLPSEEASVAWVGDNSAALSWVRNLKCGSNNPACQRVFMAITVLEQLTRIDLRDTRQILSEDMADVDAVSRGKFDNLTFLTPDTKVDISGWSVIPDLLSACNPFVLQNLDAMHDSFKLVASILASVGPAPSDQLRATKDTPLSSPGSTG